MTRRDDRDRRDKGSLDYHNIWQFPGGGLEFGEGVEDCLHREIREELGVDIKIIALVPKLYHEVRQRVWHGLIIAHLCRLTVPNSQIWLNREATEYRWYTAFEIQKLPTLPFCREIVLLAHRLKTNLPTGR